MGMWGGAPPIYETGLRYQREPRGEERWLPPSDVLRRGHGDCEDLAAYRAAELRVTGEDPEAEARVVRTGPRTWHAVVLRGDGDWEDPSAALGMELASGIIAPVRFRLDPEGHRDYRARVELAGLGGCETVECVGLAPDALLGAVNGALETEVGFLPFVAPFLNIASQAAQAATTPRGAAPPRPAGPRPPAVYAGPQPGMVLTPGLMPGMPGMPGAAFEDGIIRLAQQLSALARTEVQRRTSVRDAKLRSAMARR